MPNVAILPTPLARASAASINPRNRGTCGIYDVAGRLGQAHRQPKYICASIDALIAGAGFPRPYPLARAGRLIHDCHADSRWPLAAVDDWFDSQLPPEARATVARAERVEIDSRLAARAATLFEGDAA